LHHQLFDELVGSHFLQKELLVKPKDRVDLHARKLAVVLARRFCSEVKSEDRTQDQVIERKSIHERIPRTGDALRHSLDLSKQELPNILFFALFRVITMDLHELLLLSVVVVMLRRA
jgi:hypothetical protein